MEEKKQEIIKLLEKSKLSKTQKEELINYVNTGVKPKNPNEYKYNAFYDGYNRVRLLTKIGNLMQEFKLMKKM